jgi:hypothetical protein
MSVELIQPGYNPKPPYLPIPQKCASHKRCIISELQKSMELGNVFNVPCALRGYGTLPTHRNEDASEKNFVATRITVFGFELFRGGRSDLLAAAVSCAIGSSCAAFQWAHHISMSSREFQCVRLSSKP